MGQPCTNNLPDSAGWAASSEGFVRWKSGLLERVLIQKVEEGKFRIPDVTAGFFAQNRISYYLEVDVNIDCDGRVAPIAFISEFGEGSIKSGRWDPSSGHLVLRWEIPSNNLDATSVFKVSNPVQ